MENIGVQYEISKILEVAGVPLCDITATYLGNAVRLSGNLDVHGQKERAVELVRKIIGGRSNAVGIPVADCPDPAPDASIRVAIEDSFRRHWLVPHKRIRVGVLLGNVTLEGTVAWKFQKIKVAGIARRTPGVRMVTDRILIAPKAEDALEKAAVEEGLKNNWALDDCRITVGVDSDTVYLSGTVASQWQKKQAERIAWRVPGVWNVINDLVVDY